MEANTDESGWSYYVLCIRNPSIPQLQARLQELGADGWEVVTSVTTVKTWLNLTGNNLVFVLKKSGRGHVPYASAPTIEQQSYLAQLLRQRGFSVDEAEGLQTKLRDLGLWNADTIYELSAEWQTFDRAAIEAWITGAPLGS